jgi:Glyoxalase-like domain
MGTHNHLMQLGDEVFLEIIAVNPDASAPSRPRWYALDDPFVKAHLAKQPQLLTWVINTRDITALQKRSLVPLGAIEPMRRGTLEWLITISADGSLPGAGLLPSLIQWHTDNHPASRMPNLNCSLLQLEIYHPQVDWLRAVLTAVDAEKHVKIYSLLPNRAAYLVAHIQTPLGVRHLTSQIGIGNV